MERRTSPPSTSDGTAGIHTAIRMCFDAVPPPVASIPIE
jgi:hypothetical protein